ncbi:MAG: histidinol-phosphatase HisJ family protein [Eubacterium sp.]|nr:histidinol-phosphatase HisJ family protein [Eubacterium sp.]
MSDNLIKYDYHLHTCFSADCDSPIEDIIKSAKTKGLNSLCFTDHNDLDFPETPDNIKFDLDIEKYIDTLSKIKEREASNSIINGQDNFEIKIGLEQGVMPSTCNTLNTYSKEHPGLDFIICSSHVVDNGDPYYPESWQYPDGSYKDENTLYRKYYEDMLYNVSHFTDYNVYGHIDYIFRYGPDNKKGFQKVTEEIFRQKYFPRFSDIIREILKNIIDNNKGLEINTGSLYRGMDFAHPHIEILKLYKELGGQILTIGSDAHDLEHIGYKFDYARELAKSVGLRYYCTFNNMEAEYHPL